MYLSTFQPFVFIFLTRYAKEMSEKSFQLLGLIKRVSQLFKKLHEGKVYGFCVNFLISQMSGAFKFLYWGEGGGGMVKMSSLLRVVYTVSKIVEGDRV